MRKLIVLLSLLAACTNKQDLIIKNDCDIAWARVVNGKGQVVATLDPGEKEYVLLEGSRGGYDRMVLEADFYLVGHSYPKGNIGSSTATFTLGDRSVSGLDQTAWNLRCPDNSGNWTFSGGVLR